jgi:SAM-dependent methyltransferase
MKERIYQFRDEVVALTRGTATRVPFLYRMLGQKHTNLDLSQATADYSYAIWIKHLANLHETIGCGVPNVVAELGPGDTLGTGVAALLSGATRYIGIDKLPFARTGPTIEVANGLVPLFATRKSPGGEEGVPRFRHLLDKNGFLSSVLTDDLLSRSLDPSRVRAILEDVSCVVRGAAPENGFITYVAPFAESSIPLASVDLLLSHSVLEHVSDLRESMGMLHQWLKPGAVMSHQFDLRSHGLTHAWDGHRAFGARAWGFVVGARPFLINRLPFAAIVNIVESSGFRILTALRHHCEPTLSRSQLAEGWRDQPGEELSTDAGFIQAQKV